MPEILTTVRSQVDKTAGRKSPAAVQNRSRTAYIQSALTYPAPGITDTLATGLMLKQGTRLSGMVLCSMAAGTAASTVSIGLRDATTRVAIDATAILNAEPFNAAQTVVRATGTKVTNGQEYYIPQDAEIYLTIGGAAGLANQQFRFEVGYIGP